MAATKAAKSSDKGSTGAKAAAPKAKAAPKPKSSEPKPKSADGTEEFYCVKCKAKVKIPEGETRVETAENGRRMRKGKCPTCGTNVTRIMGKSDT